MFLKNKYTAIYFELIANRLKLNRQVNSELFENHHILPKSFGGSDSTNNMVLLTPREHYIAHKLLTKITSGKYKAKMIFAFGTFFNFNTKRNKLNTSFFRSRDYEYFKKNMSDAMVIRNTGVPIRLDTHIFKNVTTGEIITAIIMEFKNYSGLSYAEVNHLTKGSHKIIKNWTIFDKSLNCFRNEIPYRTPDLSSHNKTCVHCNKTVSIGNYARWHGDNCKIINPIKHKKSIENLVIGGSIEKFRV